MLKKLFLIAKQSAWLGSFIDSYYSIIVYFNSVPICFTSILRVLWKLGKIVGAKWKEKRAIFHCGDSFVLNTKPQSLADREKEHRLTYVTLSWVIKFSNLEIQDREGISENRLCRKIRVHSKMEKRLIEERGLCEMEQHTLKYFN